MPSDRGLWPLWKRFARRAAETQGQVLFFLLYFLAIVPMGLFRMGSSSALARRAAGEPPRWRDHDKTAADLESSMRQF
jgi:hypothetical protein